MNSAVDLWRGIATSPVKTAKLLGTKFSVGFTIVKGLDYCFPDAHISGVVAFSIIGLIAVGLTVHEVWKPSKTEICIANCATRIDVIFDDLFSLDGIRVIGVNDFFDSELGKPVSPKTLHGMLIQQCFGGHADAFDRELGRELAGVKADEVAIKTAGKNQKYQIGTTALVNANSERYLLVALAESDPLTCKANSTVTMLWNSLNSMWARARVECGGYPLNVPLLGSGLSGVGLPTIDLLNLIILSAITETKARQITGRIRIVLHRDRFKDIDLRDVKKHWEEK